MGMNMNTKLCWHRQTVIGGGGLRLPGAGRLLLKAQQQETVGVGGMIGGASLSMSARPDPCQIFAC